MSIGLMNAVWRSGKYDKTTLLVLLALADQANDKGECWPAVATVASRARCSERHVRSIIADLEKTGALTIRHRSGTSSIYRLCVEHFATSEKSSGDEPQFRGEKSSGVNPSSGGGGTPVQGGDEPQFTQTTNEPPMNLPPNGGGMKPPKQEALTGEVIPTKPAQNVGVLMAEWLEFRRDNRPPGRTIGHVSGELQKLLDEGIDFDTIRQGFALWAKANRSGPGGIHIYVNQAQAATTKPEDGADWMTAPIENLIQAADRSRAS